MDEATLTAIGAALGTTVDAATYYKVKVSAKTDSSVTLIATTKGTISIKDVMDGSDEEYIGTKNIYVQELIYKMNQKPMLDLNDDGIPDEIPGYDSWWDLVMAQAA